MSLGSGERHSDTWPVTVRRPALDHADGQNTKLAWFTLLQARLGKHPADMVYITAGKVGHHSQPHYPNGLCVRRTLSPQTFLRLMFAETLQRDVQRVKPTEPISRCPGVSLDLASAAQKGGVLMIESPGGQRTETTETTESFPKGSETWFLPRCLWLALGITPLWPTVQVVSLAGSLKVQRLGA